jgi:hypothetical protein
MTVVVRWKIGQRTWQTGPVEDRFLRAKLLHPVRMLPENRARWSDWKALVAAVRRGEVQGVPVARRTGYWSSNLGYHAADIRDAAILRVSFEYPLPARGEPRPCAGAWSKRTLTRTGCENVAIGRFYRVGADLKRHKVWLCADCGGGQ